MDEDPTYAYHLKRTGSMLLYSCSIKLRAFIFFLVIRILYVRNLPFKITAEEMYDIFGKYGAIRQIRL